METKDALDLAERFIESINKSKAEFLDTRLKEWAEFLSQNFVEKAPDARPLDRRSAERMSLLKEITKEVATYSRRDMRMSKKLAESRWKLFLELDQMRKDDGVTPELHPTILALKAELAFLCKDFEKGKDFIDKAIEANESYPFKTKERERIRLASLKSRALFGCGMYDEAVDVADHAVSQAESLSESKEKTALQSTCTKGKGAIPVVIYAVFSSCDSRVNSAKWNVDDAIREEFMFLWNKSIIDHNAPKSWNPPLQIAVISDHFWSKRVGDYTKTIAEDLYISLSNSNIEQFFRKARAFWAGTPMHVPAALGPRAAAGLLLIAVISSSSISLVDNAKVRDAVQPVAEIVEQQTSGGVSKNEAESFILQSLTEEENDSLDELAEVIAEDIEKAIGLESDEISHLTIAYHGEGSAERI